MKLRDFALIAVVLLLAAHSVAVEFKFSRIVGILETQQSLNETVVRTLAPEVR